jgi:hypothetical protein
MKEVLDFIEKLKEERNNINQKLRFVREHKFEREAEFLQEKVNVINNIIFELNDVATGKQKGIDSKFGF